MAAILPQAARSPKTMCWECIPPRKAPGRNPNEAYGPPQLALSNAKKQGMTSPTEYQQHLVPTGQSSYWGCNKSAKWIGIGYDTALVDWKKKQFAQVLNSLFDTTVQHNAGVNKPVDLRLQHPLSGEQDPEIPTLL
ncbi:unnamed protein product [Pleuronectes platessa]|uniref:Uncharacterized protein n=1 Tax=Pleuronectes platessa TaxID=8262 RepID=A0A9N7VBE9_PLEPL|nr:unnamed protein product [Pleuronectes platessa]